MSNLEILKYGSKQLQYSLHYAERKTLGIRVHPDCSIEVIAPVHESEERIKEKVREKAPWIINQQNEFLSYHPLTPPRKYTNGETHLYLGKQYRLKKVEGESVEDVKLKNGRLILTLKSTSKPSRLLDKWYREKAEIHFSRILDETLPRFHKYGITETPPLLIRKMETRWGSCTPKGKILLNPELIKAHKGSIQYVIVHELCHLVHHNHTKAFYNLQEAILPSWKKWKQLLEIQLI